MHLIVEIGVVGKPNVGKSSFFKAATTIDVAIANYPFTTIKPNIGMSAARIKCPCRELKVKCSPKRGSCFNGERFIPVELMDVAGLVPGAHEGRGLGNAFLDDLRRAECLLHIVDSSGTTDAEGKFTSGYDPCLDVLFLEEEIDMWFAGVLEKNWKTVARRVKASEKLEDVLTEMLAGLCIKREHIALALEKESPAIGNLLKFAKTVRAASKPIIIVANKMDMPESRANLKKLRDRFPDKKIIPSSANIEIALRQAAKGGMIDYLPGDASFNILGNPSQKQKEALDIMLSFLKECNGAGVQQAINTALFEVLDRIIVYPVENDVKFSDGAGNVLPDAFLLKRGSNPRDMAAAIHSDIAENFVCAVDARKKMKIAAESVLNDGDIIKIMFKTR